MKVVPVEKLEEMCFRKNPDVSDYIYEYSIDIPEPRPDPVHDTPTIGKGFTDAEGRRWVRIEQDRSFYLIESQEHYSQNEAFEAGAISYGAVNPVNGAAVMIPLEVVWATNHDWWRTISFGLWCTPSFTIPVRATHCVFPKEGE